MYVHYIYLYIDRYMYIYYIRKFIMYINAYNY